MQALETGVRVIVIGAGRFGRHYLRILAGLNLRRPTGIPFIARLVFTRTDPAMAAAIATARALRDDPACHIPEVTGRAAASGEDVARQLEIYRPALTCITARDPRRGEAVHAEYSHPALHYGAVLCEKPLADAVWVMG